MRGTGGAPGAGGHPAARWGRSWRWLCPCPREGRGSWGRASGEDALPAAGLCPTGVPGVWDCGSDGGGIAPGCCREPICRAPSKSLVPTERPSPRSEVPPDSITPKQAGCATCSTERWGFGFLGSGTQREQRGWSGGEQRYEWLCSWKPHWFSRGGDFRESAELTEVPAQRAEPCCLWELVPSKTGARDCPK